MKKLFALFICFGLSGCYVPADYYYEDQYVVSDGYAAPAYTTSYVTAAPTTVVYEQPAVIYYDSPLIAPRLHYYHHAPARPHHAAPHHGGHHPAPHHGGHQPKPAPHGGSHHGGGHSPAGHGHHK